MNVWVALTYGGHDHHAIAKSWFVTLEDDDRICFCRFTQISLLRLLTTSAVMGEAEVLTQVDAWDSYDRWQEDDRVLLLEEPPHLEAGFRRLTRLNSPSAKNWSDAYLAAFANVSAMRLVTFDRAFHGRVDNLLILKSK